LVLSAIDRRINSWGTLATSAAGAVIPTIVTAIRHLSSVEYPMRTPALDKVEAWAKNGDPRAIILHTKILGRREQYQEALALLENLMEKTYPTKVRPPFREDVTLQGILEAPWELYAWLKERVGDQEATDRVLKFAALEYQDPRALVEYAHLMQLQGNMEKYEECMNKAAASGHAEACRKLGNLYYLTFLGRFTPREEKSESHNTFSAKLFRFFGQSRTRDDFRKLAIDWYELAFMHGSDKAALVLSILLREDGQSEQALRYLESAEKARKFPKNVNRLRDNWDRADFSLPVPEPLLDT
jgi:TPR repeat protein